MWYKFLLKPPVESVKSEAPLGGLIDCSFRSACREFPYMREHLALVAERIGRQKEFVLRFWDGKRFVLGYAFPKETQPPLNPEHEFGLAWTDIAWILGRLPVILRRLRKNILVHATELKDTLKIEAPLYSSKE